MNRLHLDSRLRDGIHWIRVLRAFRIRQPIPRSGCAKGIDQLAKQRPQFLACVFITGQWRVEEGDILWPERLNRSAVPAFLKYALDGQAGKACMPSVASYSILPAW